MGRKLIVIGLDGATWDLLRPWAEEGKLPHIKKMISEGVWGQLRSAIPPLTGPAWVSFATGKNPGAHGFYDFVLPKGSLSRLRPITTRDIQGKTFYEILYENGRKCIIINLPASYPPRIQETIITSILSQGNDFFHPASLVTEIAELKEYRILPDMSILVSGDDVAHIEDIRRCEETRFQCATKLFTRDWDFFFLLFSATDWAQHRIYDKLISDKVGENSAPKLYQEIDGYIGWFIDNKPNEVDILIVSDHGFKVAKRLFSINVWLKREGYLVTESGAELPLARTRGEEERRKLVSGKKVIRLPTLLSDYLIRATFLYPIYRMIRKVIPLRIEASILQAKISETAALATLSIGGIGGVYINDRKRFTDGKVLANQYENMRSEIMDKLGQLVDVRTGQRVVREIWKKEDIYHGERLSTGPDIVFSLSDEYQVTTNLSAPLFTDCKSNTHAQDGIFLAYGPDIKKNLEVQGANICDLAPTILHILGQSVPKDMDGVVLREIFSEAGELALGPVRYQDVDEKKRIIKRIQDLKAISKI